MSRRRREERRRTRSLPWKKRRMKRQKKEKKERKAHPSKDRRSPRTTKTNASRLLVRRLRPKYPSPQQVRLVATQLRAEASGLHHTSSLTATLRSPVYPQSTPGFLCLIISTLVLFPLLPPPLLPLNSSHLHNRRNSLQRWHNRSHRPCHSTSLPPPRTHNLSLRRARQPP